ncbi:MAG: hypothetical protein J3Q66DRAFT_347212 [Benniella sp.]|nr:MAG: hypothetical protein J3Q66DRAFT_347212 [Benniella sp.]
MRFLLKIVGLALSAPLVLGANSCNVHGFEGTCISTNDCAASRGTSTPGFCPRDPRHVQCCTYGACQTKSGASGKCISTEACAGSSGTSIPGLCPGPRNIQCCIPEKPKPLPDDFDAEAVITAARSRLGVPYSWGGGHAATPGPSLGTCVGYTGSILPCPADKTVGLNCSGLVRDAIYQGTGIDLANGGNSHSQLQDPHTRRITYEERQPGDIEFFGTPARTNHVILYVGRNATGQDMMIEAQRTGTDVHEVPLRTGGTWARVRK